MVRSVKIPRHIEQLKYEDAIAASTLIKSHFKIEHSCFMLPLQTFGVFHPFRLTRYPRNLTEERENIMINEDQESFHKPIRMFCDLYALVCTRVQLAQNNFVLPNL